ncbi:MAG: universal stress protein [Ferruginibacter sp.]|nr:universal stress protein [Ferruginibacter sp.]
MKRILVPVDFSTTAENAAIFAVQLAEFYKADLWLYHSYQLIAPYTEIGFSAITPADLLNATEFELDEFKIRIENKIRTSVNIFTRIENIDLQNGLANFCNELKPDLIVMGLSGKSALTKLVVGSNTISAIEHLKVPILVVPTKATFAPIRKIGFACDYKKIIETTPLALLKKIVKDFNANLFVINVSNDKVLDNEKISESSILDILIKDLNPNYRTVYAEEISEGINWFAKQEELDWLVVIPKKHNLMDKLFKRSQTKELLYHTNVLILCMHD